MYFHEYWSVSLIQFKEYMYVSAEMSIIETDLYQ